MTFPAVTAALSGRYAESPCAIVSALTNSSTARASLTRYGALVLLPAPFGPARTTTSGGCEITSTLSRTNADGAQDDHAATKDPGASGCTRAYPIVLPIPRDRPAIASEQSGTARDDLQRRIVPRARCRFRLPRDDGGGHALPTLALLPSVLRTEGDRETDRQL